MSTRGSRPSMREGPLSELFRSTDAMSGERGRLEDEPDAGRPGDLSNYVAMIRVIGVGGAGCNAVDRMIEAGLRGVEFIAVNTDRQALEVSEADVRIPVGMEITRGLGTGGDASLGEQAVRESEEQIRRALRGSDLVFIAAGEGGGTGTGGAPLIAKIAREMGALTIAVVTRPFGFEGNRRIRTAEDGLSRLQGTADTVIIIPNDRLMGVLERGTSMVEAFKVCDDLLRQGVQGICDLITLPGLINLDFADVRTIIRGAGTALLGIGYAGGGNRATDAAEAAIASPLLETPIDGAKGILLGVTGGPDLSLVEVSEAARVVADAADPDANIIFGATIDPDLQGQVWVTVVAANFSGERAVPRVEEPPPARRPTTGPRRGERAAAPAPARGPEGASADEPARPAPQVTTTARSAHVDLPYPIAPRREEPETAAEEPAPAEDSETAEDSAPSGGVFDVESDVGDPPDAPGATRVLRRPDADDGR
ncbi:MAG: cell division protein FtsZ [Thermoleophilia bacterium]